MTAPAPLIATDLHKTYPSGDGRVTALAGVDLSVADGEMIAIMGASGSGKSTLLHLLAGLSQPDQGNVAIAGQDLAALDDRAATRFRRQQLGVVFQAFNLVPTLSASHNVALPLTLDGRPQREALVAAVNALKRVGLEHRVDHRPDQLSGGEQQRVAIARALIADPSLILADEPTGNLDSQTTTNICRLLAELVANQQRSMVLVTHEPAVAWHAHQVVVLADGRIADRFATRETSDAGALAARYHSIVGSAV